MGREKKNSKKTGMANPECQRKYWEYLKAQYIKRGGMPIHTPLFESLPEPAYQSLEASVCYPKRLGKASEIAHLAVFIAENDYLNAECIRLDGAIRMQPR